MTARDLMKALETCDLDKEVGIVISIIKNEDEAYVIVLKPIEEILEREDHIALK